MNEENKEYSKSSSKKIILILFIAIFVVFVVARYTTDEKFRSLVDTNVFKKEVSEATLNSVDLNSSDNPSVFAFDKYVAILSKNILREYTQDAKEVAKLEINISVPIVDTSDKYMVLAEKDGNNIYLISGTNILWSTKIEGNISRVNVNDNGYVSVIITNTTHKSVVAFIDLTGNELFRTYISKNYAICTSVSKNDKYLAIGEVDYSGTILKSIVKIISVEKALADPQNSIIYTYESDKDQIITNIEYKDKDTCVCMFNDYIQKITLDSNERLYDRKSDDLFIDINLNDSIAIIEKQSSGLFSYEYEIKIKNVLNNVENLYILNSDLPKSEIVSGTKIALNLGNEIQIVNQQGWLQKKYTSNSQISNIILGNSIAGIVYKNKVELINL